MNYKSIEKKIYELIETGVFELIGDGISIQNTDMKILYQNSKHKSFIGDHAGESCYKAYEKRDNICEGCPLIMSFEDGLSHTEERSAPINGEIAYFEITASPIRDKTGNIIAGLEVVRDITKNKELQNSIIQAKKEWEETFDIINEAITIHDKNYNIIRANKAAKEMLGLPFLKMFSQKCYESYHGTGSPPEKCPSCHTMKTSEPTNVEIFEPYLDKYIETKAFPRLDNDNQSIGVVHIVRDISKRKKAEEALQKSEERFRNLVETTSDWIWEVDENAVYTYVSPNIRYMLGYEPEEVIGKTPFDIMPPEKAKRVKEIFNSITASQKPFKELENENLHKNGYLVTLETSGVPFFDADGSLRGYRGIDRDITDRKRMENKLRAAAITDDLTGLLNRRGFFTLADQQCKLATRKERMMALVYIDVDNLKTINDNLGHEAGDQALKDISKIFKKTFRESDIVARIGGDEFAVLLTELTDQSACSTIINNLQKNIQIHNDQGNRKYELSVTTGISLYEPELPCSIGILLNQADKSMYKNKILKKY